MRQIQNFFNEAQIWDTTSLLIKLFSKIVNLKLFSQFCKSNQFQIRNVYKTSKKVRIERQDLA